LQEDGVGIDSGVEEEVLDSGRFARDGKPGAHEIKRQVAAFGAKNLVINRSIESVESGAPNPAEHGDSGFRSRGAEDQSPGENPDVIEVIEDGVE
jgi:hypothetical protein